MIIWPSETAHTSQYKIGGTVCYLAIVPARGKRRRILVKISRIFRGIALTAFLGAIGSVPAFAAGWTQVDGVWKYTDSRGEYVSNQWEMSNGRYYYLGGDGNLVTNSWIDDEYYVDGNGTRLTDTWVIIEDSNTGKDPGWYYLTSNGKCKKDGWETINGRKYAFDEDGKMRYGWFFDDDDIYYLGDETDGAMKTGWRCLSYDEENTPDDGDVSEQYDSAGDDAKWFYFRESGKAAKADSEGYESHTVNDKKYYFDENGVMVTGWAAVKDSAESGDVTGISKFVYLGTENEGNMYKNTWVYLDEHPGDSDDGEEISDSYGDMPEEGDNAWYYLEGDGTPAYLKSSAKKMGAATTKVGNHSYFFNPYGVMRTGLIRITTDNGEIVGYFGDDQPEDSNPDSEMRTGKATVYDDFGEKYTFYFNDSGSNKGAGYSGEKNNFLYSNGVLVKAEDGMDYEAFKVDGKVYLVNETGKVQTSSKAYKCDGTYTYRISGGKVYYTDDEGEADGEVTEGGSLPDVEYHEEYDL